MKILRLSLLNLNSLRGEHSVDFCQEPLASAGIFAITGQTGAGKSTLLDAITLALYGRAARYGESPNPEDMMSRHTGECRAEVEFEVAGHQPYRAVWQLRRAKGRSDGKLQPPKRYLYDAEGQVLAEKVRDVDQQIEALCRLDYNRFTRSVLLAQGEFAKFLKAKPDQRAELLESLTQTSVYSELGQLVYEELSDRQRSLDESERMLSQIALLLPTELETQKATVKQLERDIATAKTSRTEQADIVAKARQLSQQLQTQADLQQQGEKLEQQLKAAEPDLRRIAQHQLAAPLFPTLLLLEQAETEQQRRALADQQAQAQLASTQQRWMQALQLTCLAGEREQQALQTSLADDQKQRSTSTTEVAALSDWLAEHRQVASLGEQLPDLSTSLTILGRVRSQLAELQRPDDTQYADLAAAQARLTELLEQRSAEQRQQDLEKQEAQLQHLRTLATEYQTLPKLESPIEELADQLATTEKRHAEAEPPAAAAAQQCQEAETRLKDYREHLRLIERVASLEDQRLQLAAGDPCPLCGSTEHPFVEHETESELLTGGSEIEAKIRTAERSLATAQAHHQQTRDLLTQTTSELKVLRERKAAAEARLQEAQQSLAERAQQLQVEADLQTILARVAQTEKDIEQAKQALLQIAAAQEAESYFSRQVEIDRISLELQPVLDSLETPLPEPGTESATYERLESRWQSYQAQLQKKTALTEKLESIERQITKTDEQLLALGDALAPLSDTRSQQTDMPPSAPALPADLTFAAARTQLDEIAAQLQSSQVLRDSAARELAEAGKETDQRAAELVTQIEPSDFADRAALVAARLADDEAQHIAQVEQDLKQQQQSLKGRSELTEQAIAKLREEKLPEPSEVAKLEAEVQDLQEKIERSTAELTTLKIALETDDKQRKIYEKQTASLRADRDQLQVWSQLSALIGDARGKKFRVYAQGISLDLLIRRANHHLHRLTPRYRLSRVQGEELELQIEDRHQASVTRPMASLSGGESFLASLALALGLSDLAGRHVQIDSLFIDEGFGTLDSDTLEIAISALEGLMQSDKTVGVISHVEILKERITTQIVVEKQPNGTSQLQIRR